MSNLNYTRLLPDLNAQKFKLEDMIEAIETHENRDFLEKQVALVSLRKAVENINVALNELELIKNQNT